MFGDLHILDENMQSCPKGTPGTVWFKTGSPFEYFNDQAKTKDNDPTYQPTPPAPLPPGQGTRIDQLA